MFAKTWLAVIAIGCAQAQWTPELQMRVKTVADVTPSRDGKLVAWVENRALMDGEKSEMNSQIYLAQADGTDRIQLTRGEKSANSPEFSPNGHFIYFASEREGKRGFYRVPVDGGEAEQIGPEPGVTAAGYHLSPNGKWIAFSGTPARPAIELARKEKRDFRVIDENPANAALYLVATDADVNGKRASRVLATGPFSVGAFDWSPDSRTIAFETRPGPGADFGRKADLSEVDVESGKLQAIASTEASEASPRYSPDGKYLAFVRSQGPGGLAANRIVLFARVGGKLRELPASPDELPNLLGWSGDSKRMYFAEPKGTKEVLYGMPVDGPPSAVFTPKGTFGALRLNAAGTFAGVALQSVSEPVEAYSMDLKTMKPVQVSAANSGLNLPPLGETTVIRWKGKDGKPVEGILTLPVGYEKGKKVPLILNIHGGPSGGFNEAFIGASGLYPIASFAAKGYAVLRPNPRGSVGYGHAARISNVNDWGGGDYQDLMTGVDHVISMGVADPDRLIVMGWSYGGFMTNWVIGQTTRFKAAATGAGLSDMVSMWATNDIPSTLDDYFSGTPMDEQERYIKMSPLYYAKNVTTPTLFLHGEIDPRVPTTQGYEMYHALKRRGIETVMVVYPRTLHGPQEPKFVLDIMQRHLEWVGKHI
jgi:dipeptidyl aminopeptidase/acylaminoacyl peptidase